jgi:hypothetical protein
LIASPIERDTILFAAWKERRTFGADNSLTLRSRECEQVCHNVISVWTGEKVSVPAKLVVTFKPGREMEERVGQLKKVPEPAAVSE